MPFYSERQRLAQLQKREADGENLWTDIAPDALRNKVLRVIQDINRDVYDSYPRRYGHNVLKTAQALLTADIGQDSLTGRTSESVDMEGYILNCDHKFFPDALEAVYAAIRQDNRVIRSLPLEERFESEVNKLLESYRINYSLGGGVIQPLSSREIHSAIIKPTLNLIAKGGWDSVEDPYVKAINEIADGNPDDAITDATTAMQEAFRLMGCSGKDFRALTASAKKKFFQGADAKYVDAVEKLIEWISASRVNKGDTHKTVKPTSNDAWFVVHVVGILILYLSQKE